MTRPLYLRRTGRAADLEDQATVDGKPHEVRQSRVRIRIPRDNEVHSQSVALSVSEHQRC